MAARTAPMTTEFSIGLYGLDGCVSITVSCIHTLIIVCFAGASFVAWNDLLCTVLYEGVRQPMEGDDCRNCVEHVWHNEALFGQRWRLCLRVCCVTLVGMGVVRRVSNLTSTLLRFRAVYFPRWTATWLSIPPARRYLAPLPRASLGTRRRKWPCQR